MITSPKEIEKPIALEIPRPIERETPKAIVREEKPDGCRHCGGKLAVLNGAKRCVKCWRPMAP